jgi:hypothetical protein
MKSSKRTLALSVLALALSLSACGEERRPATDTEKETVLGVLSTGLHLRDTRSTDHIALPPMTETLLNLVIDAICQASVTTTQVGDHKREALTFNCKDGDFQGDYVRELDHYSFDLRAKTSMDIEYKGDVTARRDFLDGNVDLSAKKDLYITDIGVSDHIEFQGIQMDASGCMIGGGMRMLLHANVPLKKIDIETDALFGPTCGEVWVKK